MWARPEHLSGACLDRVAHLRRSEGELRHHRAQGCNDKRAGLICAVRPHGETSREFFRLMLSQQIMWNDFHRHLIFFRTLSQSALLDVSNVSTCMLTSAQRGARSSNGLRENEDQLRRPQENSETRCPGAQRFITKGALFLEQGNTIGGERA